MLKADSALVAALVLVVLVLEAFTGLLRSVDNRFFDSVSLLTQRSPSNQVVVLAIDDESIANIGRWPWSRDVHAKVVEQLTQGKAKTVVHTSFFFEPQIDRGLSYLQQLQQVVASADSADPVIPRLTQALDEAIRDLDADTILADSLQRSQRVMLPMIFELGEPLGRAEQPLPDFVTQHALRPQGTLQPLYGVKAHTPLTILGSRAAGVGHLNMLPDPGDGSLRAQQLFIEHDGFWVGSLAMQTAAHSLNLTAKDLAITPSDQLKMGGVMVPLDGIGQFYPQFYKGQDGREAFAVDSFFDVYSGKIPANKYAGKIVIIGATATGVGDRFVTPISAVTSPPVVLAHTMSSLMNGHFFSAPDWGAWVGMGAILAVSLLVALALPALSAGVAAVVTGTIFVVLLISEAWLIASSHTWVPMTQAAVVLVVAYLGLTTKRFLFAEAGRIKSDEESAETNRMMGLAHQGQGQLDLAFDRFRRVPMTGALMDNLSNLALDFERKRQFNKAQAVYEHMAAHNPDHRDLSARLKRVKVLSETVMLGGSGSHPGGTLLLDGDHIEKPMLGRYQVEKELGKGAMGVVYMGRDPKIGRVVAIKTMALSQEFEGAELEDARQRFFREAETAGRLQHQNIVTIFDAGEDHELAYIAMEYLKGKDLLEYTKPGQLLPVETVVGILIRIAEALQYAHGLNVVHRDIKPANIMYDPATGAVKVTDFGIARVTDASRTRTGMVLGTPSFMSPEQIAGKKVDGRSDLYSLGVMAYQLLSGFLPFHAESMTELMFKIANEPAPDIRTANPTIPAELAAVVSKALAKTLDIRYESGDAFAHDLRQALAETGHLKPIPSDNSPQVIPALGERTDPLFLATEKMDVLVSPAASQKVYETTVILPKDGVPEDVRTLPLTNNQRRPS
ncbi:MAG: serine/threonine-protein kinase [Hydrogenophaga sp.]|uniref:CHASE2 domain-containing serine/threonine-protein kinase n=1 Tax=Hydrogenophaga sp. TaxID=1904254 RepID=UPI002ABA75E5|nr:serine/threonine-protein kinase [Hydrogenophaga sp.]MDZ4188464.1 serine/threonine-protein kinase [Hydrogenophaga sp.]